MNRIKITLILLATLMATTVAMSACGNVCSHMDNDQNGVCDLCRSPMTSESETAAETQPESETLPETEPVKYIISSITVKDQYGKTVSGAVLQINDASNTAVETVTTGADGTVDLTLAEGRYTAIFMELPEYHLGGTAAFEIKEGEASPVLEVINNTPDGSEEHPIFLNSDSATFSFSANTPVHFTLFAGDRRSIVIENAADIEITLNGTSHTADANGLIKVPIIGDQQQNHVTLIVTSKVDGDVTIGLVAELGSSDNPIVIEELGTITVTVPKDRIVYYSYTVTDDSITTIDLHSNDATNNISMTNRTTNVTTNFTNGSTANVYLNVKKGDVIVVAVSVLGGDASLDSYTLEFVIYGGKG